MDLCGGLHNTTIHWSNKMQYSSIINYSLSSYKYRFAKLKPSHNYNLLMHCSNTRNMSIFGVSLTGKTPIKIHFLQPIQIFIIKNQKSDSTCQITTHIEFYTILSILFMNSIILFMAD